MEYFEFKIEDFFCWELSFAEKLALLRLQFCWEISFCWDFNFAEKSVLLRLLFCWEFSFTEKSILLRTMFAENSILLKTQFRKSRFSIRIFWYFFKMKYSKISSNFNAKIQICLKVKFWSKLIFWTKIRISR